MWHHPPLWGGLRPRPQQRVAAFGGPPLLWRVLVDMWLHFPEVNGSKNWVLRKVILLCFSTPGRRCRGWLAAACLFFNTSLFKNKYIVVLGYLFATNLRFEVICWIVYSKSRTAPPRGRSTHQKVLCKAWPLTDKWHMICKMCASELPSKQVMG